MGKGNGKGKGELRHSEVVTRAKEILRQGKIKRTRPRLAILSALVSDTSPETVEEIRARAGKVDLVTVYRTLGLLVERNIVREIRFKDLPARYELFFGHHHHHLVCVKCGIVDELPECDISYLEKRVLQTARNFSTISDHALEFFGSCKSCTSAV